MNYPLSRRRALTGLLGLLAGGALPSRFLSAAELPSDALELAAVAADPIALETAVVEPAPAPAVNLCGDWNCGYWKSFCNSHHGKLRARFERCDACTYRVTFSGTFLKLVPFRYSQTLTITGYSEDRVHLSASRNIPLFGGSFTMCGSATNCNFSANYCSKKDRGVFVLSR